MDWERWLGSAILGVAGAGAVCLRSGLSGNGCTAPVVWPCLSPQSARELQSPEWPWADDRCRRHRYPRTRPRQSSALCGASLPCRDYASAQAGTGTPSPAITLSATYRPVSGPPGGRALVSQSPNLKSRVDCGAGLGLKSPVGDYVSESFFILKADRECQPTHNQPRASVGSPT